MYETRIHHFFGNTHTYTLKTNVPQEMPLVPGKEKHINWPTRVILYLPNEKFQKSPY